MKAEICAIWRLNEQATAELEKLRAVLSQFGITYGPIYGHITFAHYLCIEEAAILQYAKESCTYMNRFPVFFDELAILSTQCIVCRPRIANEMVAYYNRFHEKYDEACDLWTMATQKLWLPHCTLYYSSKENLEAIKAEMDKRFVPFCGWADKLELSVVKEQEYEVIFSQRLHGESSW